MDYVSVRRFSNLESRVSTLERVVGRLNRLVCDLREDLKKFDGLIELYDEFCEGCWDSGKYRPVERMMLGDVPKCGIEHGCGKKRRSVTK